MVQFIDLEGVILSENVCKISPVKYDSLKIENSTLDGSVHTQIIGKPCGTIEFEILCTLEQTELVGYGEATGAKFKLIKDTKFYNGWLKATPSWKRINHEYFVATVGLKISEDGTV